MKKRIEISGEARKRLSSLVSAAERRFCGRGPQAVKIRVDDELVVVTVDGFLTPLEETLLACAENQGLVVLVRERYTQATVRFWREAFHELLGLAVQEIRTEVDPARNQWKILLKVTPNA
ncbi:MAG TPA: DUF2294 family protein [Firmicutes bacterium]|nr:DUF2294 family protein [Bacillota bacterium]